MKKRASPRTLEQKLADGLKEAVEVGECLEWRGDMTSRSSLPMLKYRDTPGGSAKTKAVPRLIYELAGKTIHEGHVVYRKCCNNLCVNIDHITSGSKKQWHQHRKRMGVAKHSIDTKLKITAKARARPTTKYSMEKAMEIRELAAQGLSISETSERTGVSEAMVVDIRRNHSWKQAGGFFTGLIR